MSMVARRYARALMNLAVREKQVEQVAQALDSFAAALADSPQLAEFLSEPKVPQSGKEAVVNDILSKLKVPKLAGTFLRYLTAKRRIALAVDMQRVFHELADERMGRAHADVTVAAKLTKAQTDALRRKLERLSGKQINLRVTTDPSILGGLVARVGSTVWDGSVRNQLQQVHQQLIHSQ